MIIALPETRELDLFARMFESRGIETLRCPLIGIRDAPDPAPIENWLRRFNSGEMSDLILMTGEGLRRLWGFAERAGLENGFMEALTRVRKVARGPKPQRALRELGLTAEMSVKLATTEGVIDALRDEVLTGHCVGLQLYGEEPNERLQSFLKTMGAAVQAVAPYRYIDACDDTDVVALIEKIASRQIDAIAFTSAAQVRRLRDVAAQNDLLNSCTGGLKGMVVGAIGPIVIDELKALGINNPVTPNGSFNMKPLASELLKVLGTNSR